MPSPSCPYCGEDVHKGHCLPFLASRAADLEIDLRLERMANKELRTRLTLQGVELAQLKGLR